MSSNKLVFYHNDVDGFTGAWVFWRQWGDDAAYCLVDYGEGDEDIPLPPVEGRDVYFVDFCPPKKQLFDIYGVCKTLTVLDHHRTAEPILEALGKAILPHPESHIFQYTFDLERSGAMLAYDFFPYGNRQPYAELIRYVQDRDLWKFELPNSEAINAYIGCQPMKFERWEELHEMFVDGRVDTIVERGEAVLDSINSYVVRMIDNFRGIEWEGYENVMVVNAPSPHISELLGSMAKAHGVDFAVGWCQLGDGQYLYSLRSRGEVDVSEIAKRHGGGGHKNAAGFIAAKRVV